MIQNIPDISIIIPLYNREKLIAETLDSIVAQTFQNWECIVVDDGSTDNSWNVVTEYALIDSRIQGFKRPESLQKGANACRNFGFSKAKGSFIQWFDSDDVMLPKKLALELNEIQKKESDYCISLARCTDEQLQKKEVVPFNFNKEHSVFKNYAMGAIEVVTQMVLWRKTFLEGKDLFNPLIKRGQETELYSRLFFQSNAFALVHQETLLYRQHGETKTSKNALDYIPAYRWSQSYISNQYFEMAKTIGEILIMERYYKFLVGYLYEAAVHRDKKTVRFILEKLKNSILKERPLRFQKLLIGTKLVSLARSKNASLRNLFFDINLPN